MGRRYGFSGDQDCASSYITVAGVASATTIRPEITRIILSSPATAADYVLYWLLQRFTAAGTSTGVTPNAEDPADPASLATCGSNHSGEPTYTAAATPLGTIALHQKSTLVQEFAPGRGLKAPATAANGFGMQVKHGTATPAVLCSFGWEE